MITSLKRTSDPETEPVTTAEMESQLVIGSGFETAKVDSIISAATSHVEACTERSLITQEWTMKLNSFPTKVFLGHCPLISITSFTYLDTAGTSQTLVAGTDYTLNNNDIIPFLTAIDGWPSLYADDYREKVTVVYSAGYGEASAVPNWAKEAIKAYGTEIYTQGQVSTMDIFKSLTVRNKVFFDYALND